MTTWVESPGGGRDRGARALLRAWVEVLVRPRRFFRAAVAPGDQAPGLVFVVLVTAVATATHLLAVPGAVPVYGGRPVVSAALVVLVVAALVAPVTLHLAAALQTLALLVAVDDRAGVSETVQVVAYATAPCALAGLPWPAVTATAGAYGAVLLVLGTSEVHGTSLPRAAAAAALPAALVFGYAFRAFGAAAALAGL